jgi:putative membrane protein
MKFKSTLMGTILPMAMAVAMAAQNPAPPAKQSPPTAKTSAPEQKTSTNTAQFSNSDRLFLNALIQEDLSEIRLAQMALTKSSSPEVKQYAQTKILAADPQMKDGAVQLARKNGMEPPTSPNGRQQEIYNRLEKKFGDVFDGAYMTYEADQQNADAMLVQTEINSTSDPEIKSYVTNQEKPVVEAAAAAKEIAAKIAGNMRQYKQQPNRTNSNH